MNIISKLKPKTYLYNKSEYAYLNLPSEKQYGLIAQDLETVLPELVTTSQMPVKVINGERQMEEIKAVNYPALIPVLIKALQEQQKQIDELKIMVNKLTNGNNTSLSLSPAYLEQNTPNPSNGSTIIRYHIASDNAKARIVISDIKGRIIKSVFVSSGGSGQLILNNRALATGTYSYSLLIDGKKVDTKLMVIER
jgi:hypothetical protein